MYKVSIGQQLQSIQRVNRRRRETTNNKNIFLTYVVITYQKEEDRQIVKYYMSYTSFPINKSLTAS